jgi:hypothetical protein
MDYFDIPFELQFLSYFQTSSKKINNTFILEYDDLNLRQIISEFKSEFWINETKLVELPISKNTSCNFNEVFKSNFLVISKASCGSATPDMIERNDVLIVDLNTLKKYKVDFGKLKLTRSKLTLDEFYQNSKDYFYILDINLDNNVIRIENKKIGKLSFRLN